MGAGRTNEQIARAVLLAKANAAHHAVAQMTAEGLPGCVIRQARRVEAAAWSAYRTAVRG